MVKRHVMDTVVWKDLVRPHDPGDCRSDKAGFFPYFTPDSIGRRFSRPWPTARERKRTRAVGATPATEQYAILAHDHRTHPDQGPAQRGCRAQDATS
jgi:hypothetical protein